MKEQIQLFSPAKNNRKTVRTLALSAKWTQHAVVFTSGIGVFVWAKDLAMKYLPVYLPGIEFFAVVVGILAGIGVGYLTDVGFGNVLQDVLFRSLAAKHPNLQKWENGSDYFGRFQRVELWLKWGLLVLLLAVDIATMTVITDPVAAQAGTDKKIDIVALRADLQARHDATMADLKRTAKDKESAIKQTRSAVAASNPALAKLRATGNSWASVEIDKKARKATATDEKTRTLTEAAIGTALVEGPAYIERRVEEAEALNRETSERNERNQAIAAVMYLIFSVGLKIITIYLRILIVVSFCAYSYNFSPDLTGDGVIDYQDVQTYTSGAQPDFRHARRETAAT